MKKHAEHEAEVPVPETAPDGVAPAQAEKGNGETLAAEAKAATPDAKEAPVNGGDSAGKAANAGPKAPAPEERIAELEIKCAELQDQYLRKAADFDNYRKRMIKEKQDAIDYANSSLLVDLVQVLDDFDRALQSMSATAIANADGGHAAALTDGITMIRKQLGGMLESKYGLMYYPSKGTAFDPMIHEAIGSVPSPEVKEPTVADEFVKGYKLKDRVIRVAKVMVQMPVENQGSTH
jgi:molecular chaperone GrpE